jgi:hypothetical protein
MLSLGTIRLSSSPFSTPVLLVWKADRLWRMCVDCRVLNSKTIKDIPCPLFCQARPPVRVPPGLDADGGHREDGVSYA